MTRHCFAFALFLLIGSITGSAGTLTCDVCVYGGTSGGVTAAVQAAKMGKSVVLVSDYGHLGGLSSSGLGETDIGNLSIFGGLSKEFYQRIRIHYDGGTLSPSTPLTTRFEPKVAEGVFNQMVAAQPGITVINGLLNLQNGVTKSGQRITALHLEGGTTVQAAMFIDACYEGDLMAKAGVTFTIGREANSQYGETGNGIRGIVGQNQIPNGVDPYVVPGNSASGLLPGVNPNTGGAAGSADHRLQAYCYRMCLTNVAANRNTVAQPANYNEANYELLLRAIEAGQTTRFWKTSTMPNGKTDSNNDNGVSTDFIGKNYSPLLPGDPAYWDWSTLNHQQRAALAAEHRDWQLGLIWTVQNHPRVPASIRTTWGQWGLPKDEFTDNGNWPYNLYVREARRMVSDYVMTERNAVGTVTVPDSVAMGAYTLDSHHTQRVVSGGQVKNEGDIQKIVPAPYSISYRSIIPAVGQCENLLVPWCTSSTHISFGSIRMEPVFMILGQSAATAACMAIDGAIPIQQVNYGQLSQRLIADGQVLALGTLPEVSISVTDSVATEGVAADPARLTLTRTGGTTASLSVNLGIGGTATAGTDYPAITSPVTIPAGQASLELVILPIADGLAEIDESLIVTVATGSSYTIGTSGSGTVTLRDVPPVSSTPEVSISVTDSVATEGDAADPARLTLTRTGGTTASLSVNLGIGGTATAGTDYPAITSPVTIPAGQASLELVILPIADGLAESDESLIVTVTTGSSYTIGASASGLVTLRDVPSTSPAARTWSGGAGNWANGDPGQWGANWSSSPADTATFNGPGGTVTVQSAITTGAAALAFSSGNYTLQSNVPTVRVITLGNNNIALGNGVTTTIGAGVTLTRAGLLVVDGNTKATSTLNIDSGGILSTLGANIATIGETTVNLNTGGIIQTAQFSIVLGDSTDGATLNVLGGEVKLGSNLQAPNANNIVLGNGSTITSTVNLKTTGGSISSTTTGLFGIRVGSTSGTGVTTGIIDLEGGTTTVDQVFEGRSNHSSTLNLHGGTLKARGDNANFIGVDNVWVKSGGAKFDSNGKSITVTKALLTDVSSTGGGLTLDDTNAIKGTLTLTGLNTYSGDTTVSSGTLTLGQINAFNEASTVSIASGAVLNLTFSGTDTVNKLFLNGAQQPSGVYGISHISGLITGTGTLTVTSGPVGGYSSWIMGFGLVPADRDPADDPENDGMTNLLEFVLNGNPSLSDTSILPNLVVTSTDFEFTYQRRDDSVSPQTIQTFQWGTTLATWPGSAVISATGGTGSGATISVSPGIPNDAVTDTVKISIPKTAAGASDKLFGRLQVVK